MDERQIELSSYRMSKAEECLKSAEILAEAGDYCSAANRAYYAIFHSIRSILALDGVDFAKHAGVMSYFQREYVKTGIFEKYYSKILTEAFEVRSESDYDDYYVIDKKEVKVQIDNAHAFIAGIKEYRLNVLDKHTL